LKGEAYTKACDIFSCGVVLFILLIGYRPFEHAWREDKWYKPMCDSNPNKFWSFHSTVKIDDDSRELLNGMLTYRPKRRLTLQECLNHKWVVGQKVHSPSELKSVVVEKHRESRRQRRSDKKKMRQLNNSVKKPKRRGSSFMVKIPSVKTFVPSLLTFFAWKAQLAEAYDAALNVFNIAFKGKSRTTINSQKPWEVKTTIKVSDGVSEQQFIVVLSVCEIEGTEKVAFKFQRCLGDSLDFARIWNAAEEYLMNYTEGIFFDSLDEKSIPLEESKKDY